MVQIETFGNKLNEVTFFTCLNFQCRSAWLCLILARILEWVAFPSSRESNPGLPHSGGFFTSWATREAQQYWNGWPIPSPVDLPNPGIKPGSPALQELSGKPQCLILFISRKWNKNLLFNYCFIDPHLIRCDHWSKWLSNISQYLASVSATVECLLMSDIDLKTLELLNRS